MENKNPIQAALICQLYSGNVCLSIPGLIKPLANICKKLYILNFCQIIF